MDESFGLIVEQVESLESSTLLGGKVKVVASCDKNNSTPSKPIKIHTSTFVDVCVFRMFKMPAKHGVAP